MSPLRDRRFALLCLGQGVNSIGSFCALTAIWGYATYKFDAGPAQIAMLSLCWSLPSALFGPLGGVPVDRFGPRRVLIIADTFAIVVALALTFTTSLLQIGLLGFGIGVTKLFSEPAFAALPPRLVEDKQLLAANSYLGSAMQSGIVFGPLIAAAAIGVWGFKAAFIVDALTFMVAIAAVLPLRLRPLAPHPHDAPTGMVAEVRAGFAVVRSRPDLMRLLALGTCIYAVWGSFIVIEPLYVRDVLHRSEAVFAILQAIFGVMLFTNGLWLPRFGDRVAKVAVVRAAALVTAFAAPLYVLTDQLAIAIVGIAIWGATTAWFVAPHRTLVQRWTPQRAHGRVLALDRTLQSFAFVIGLPLSALLVAAFDVRVAGFAFALLPLLGAVFLVPRRAPRAQEAPGEDAGVVAVIPAQG
jgi:predicted MFS family arabinose efflux permease